MFGFGAAARFVEPADADWTVAALDFGLDDRCDVARVSSAVLTIDAPRKT